MTPLRFFVTTLAFSILFLLTGCQSGTEPGSNSAASVRIEGATRAQIVATTKAVFAEDGYTLAQELPGELVFQRPGNRWDAAKYGGWSGEGVTMRVNVRCSALGDGSESVRAEVRVLRNASDPFFEDDNRAMMPGRLKYQHMLDDVRDRLKKKK